MFKKALALDTARYIEFAKLEGFLLFFSTMSYMFFRKN